MTGSLIRKAPLALALALLAGVALPVTGQTGAAPTTFEIVEPHRLGGEVMVGDRLYWMAAKAGELFTTHLPTGKTTLVATVPREHDGQTVLAVHGGNILVANVDVSLQGAGWRAHIFELATGKVRHTLEGKGYASGFGFVDRDRIYVVGSGGVDIVQAWTGKILHHVTENKGILTGSCQVGNRLYVARSYPGGLLMVDLDQGKRVDFDCVEGANWLENVRVQGDKAFVIGSLEAAIVDLKARQYHPVPGLRAKNGLVPGKVHQIQGEFWFVNEVTWQVVRFDQAGKQIGTFPVPVRTHRLVGLCNGQAVFIGQDRICLVNPAR